MLNRLAIAETYSMIGSSALACVQHAPHQSFDERRLRARGRKGPKPVNETPTDAIPKGMCAACGIIGEHLTSEACIEALRSEIARLEFRIEKPPKAKVERAPKPRAPKPRAPKPPAPSPEVLTSFQRALDRGLRRSRRLDRSQQRRAIPVQGCSVI